MPTPPFIPSHIDVSAPLRDFYHFLEHDVKPKANPIDKSTKTLLSFFERLKTFHIFGLNNLDISQRHYFWRNCERASSALNLLQTQHQAAVKMLAATTNIPLQKQYLNTALSGDTLIGVGFAHLRKIDNPPVCGKLTPEGYRVNGPIRFVTGQNIFEYLAIGFVNETEEEIFALIPFAAPAASHGEISFGKIIDLPAAKSTRTISMHVKNLLIPESAILSKKPKGTLNTHALTRYKMESLHAGTALAIADQIILSPRIHEPAIADYFQQLLLATENYEQRIITRKPTEPVAPVRAAGIQLTHRWLMFAEQIFRGGSFNKNHALYRIHNEAILTAAVAADDDLLNALAQQLTI